MADILYHLLTCLVTVQVTSCVNTYLYGAPPRGGLFGGRVDTTRMSAKIRSAFTSFSDPVNVASYDPVSQQVLLDVGDGDHRSMAYGPICGSKVPEPPRHLATLSSGPISHPELGDCLDCTIYGVAMYDSVVYFVYAGMWSNDFQLTRFIEIRSFTPCEECIMSDTDGSLPDGMDEASVLHDCSTHEHDVHRTSFHAANMDSTQLTPTSTLKVIHEDQTNSFFLQILNSTGSDHESFMTLDLYHVVPSSGDVYILHRESLSEQHHLQLSRGIGGVDYNSGVLCWTVMDRVFCADYTLGETEVNNLARVLDVAGSAVYRVCSGSESSVFGVVTGIDIIEVGTSSRNIVFGCYSGAEYPDVGGTGIIRAASADWIDREITPLLNKRFKAASLFHIENVAKVCSFTPKPRMCVIGSSPEPEPEPEPENDRPVDDDDVINPESGESHKPYPATGENTACRFVTSYVGVYLCIIVSYVITLY